ncbi:hypothetical protein [Bacillus sp. 2205SS5-2]
MKVYKKLIKDLSTTGGECSYLGQDMKINIIAQKNELKESSFFVLGKIV